MAAVDIAAICVGGSEFATATVGCLENNHGQLYQQGAHFY
jgi:hypothetical protein